MFRGARATVPFDFTTGKRFAYASVLVLVLSFVSLFSGSGYSDAQPDCSVARKEDPQCNPNYTGKNATTGKSTWYADTKKVFSMNCDSIDTAEGFLNGGDRIVEGYEDVTCANIITDMMFRAAKSRHTMLGFMILQAIYAFMILPPILCVADVFPRTQSTRVLIVPGYATALLLVIVQLVFYAGESSWIAYTTMFWSMNFESKRALFLSSMLTQGRMTWLIAFVDMFLALSNFAIARITLKTGIFSRNWGRLTAFVCFVQVITVLASGGRLVGGMWMIMQRGSMWAQTLIALVLVPIWSLWLGKQLGDLPASFAGGNGVPQPEAGDAQL